MKLLSMVLVLALSTVQTFAQGKDKSNSELPKVSQEAAKLPIDFLLGKTWRTKLHDGGVLTATYINKNRILFTSTYGDSTAVIFNLKIRSTATGYVVTESARADAANGVYAITNAGEEMDVKIVDEKTFILTIDGSMPFVYKLMIE